MKTILVIENEGIVRFAIVNMLKRNGFEAMDAPNGQRGLELAKELVPDLILCNINMPRLNGYEVLKELRNQPLTKDTPFIFLTGQVSQDDFDLARKLGANDYITKPYSEDELLEAIYKVLPREFY